MYCRNCGTKCESGDSFCPVCGQKLSPHKVSSTKATPEKIDLNDSSIRTSVRNPVWAMVYNILKSHAFVIAVVSMTISLIFTYIEVDAAIDEPLDYAYDIILKIERQISYMSWSGHYDDMKQLVDMTKDVCDFIRDYFFVIMIPDVLIAIGLLATFATVVIPNNLASKAGGLTAVRIGIAIKEICLWVAFTILEIFMLAILSRINNVTNFLKNSFPNTEPPETLTKITVAVYVVMAAILVITICAEVFYSGLRTSANTVAYTIDTGNASYDVSSYSGVICIIVGMLNILNAIIRLDETAMLIALFGGTASLLIGWILTNYRSKMTVAIAEQRRITR